jgi:hypothetical protein
LTEVSEVLPASIIRAITPLKFHQTIQRNILEDSHLQEFTRLFGRIQTMDERDMSVGIWNFRRIYITGLLKGMSEITFVSPRTILKWNVTV